MQILAHMPIATTTHNNTPLFITHRAIAGTVGAVLLLTAGWGFFTYTQRHTGVDDEPEGAPWVTHDDAESQPLRGGGPAHGTSGGMHHVKKSKAMKLGAQRYGVVCGVVCKQ